jgi:hypothetical protein
MKAILLATLQTIIRALIGALNYERIKTTVTAMDSANLTGEQKRQMVVQEAKPVIAAVGTALVNLAIETAVNSLRVGK